MDILSTTRVLVIDDDTRHSQNIARFLSSHDYLVETCGGLERARDVLDRWRPHVLVLIPRLEAGRHDELEELRRICPRVPVVVVTPAEGPELILDVEAFAPAVPACPSRGLAHLASVVADASVMA